MTLLLTGPRLVLREFVPEDWEAVYAFTSQPKASRYQAWGPNTPADAQAYVEHAIAAAREEPRNAYIVAVTLAETGRLVGEGALYVRSRPFRSGEIAYLIDPAYWGQGFATEVARLLLQFGFAELQLHRIAGTCDPRNVASARVLEKVGMQYEGRMGETRLIQDGWRDSALYSILEHEWVADRQDDPQHVEQTPRACHGNTQRTDKLQCHRHAQRDAVDGGVEREVHRREHQPEGDNRRHVRAAVALPQPVPGPPECHEHERREAHTQEDDTARPELREEGDGDGSAKLDG